MQPGFKNLKRKISDQIPRLTQSQLVVANFILENPGDFALSSVRELEKELKVSKSTIVRLAQRLGYTGFHELKKAYLDSIRQDMTPINRYQLILSESHGESDFPELLADQSVTNINETLKYIDRDQFHEAVQTLKKAGHIYTLGAGVSSFLAGLACYLLTRVSLKVTDMTNHRALTFTEQVINLQKRDVLLAFAFRPYSQITVQALKTARQKKIKVVSITDSATSDLAPWSNQLLKANVECSTMSNSIVGPLMLLYAITSQIGFEIKPKTLKSIEHLQKVRRHPSHPD